MLLQQNHLPVVYTLKKHS